MKLIDRIAARLGFVREQRFAKAILAADMHETQRYALACDVFGIRGPELLKKYRKETLDAVPSSIASAPKDGMRIIVIRRSGRRCVARWAVNPNTVFRSNTDPDWLDDDGKFVDVTLDPVVSWLPL